jgi:hypothetical protein
MVSKPLALAEWRLRQGLTYRQLGVLIGVRVNLAFAYCLEPGDKGFKCPRADRMARIYEVTDGEVGPASFYRLPRLTRPFDRNAPQLPFGEAA